MNPEQRVVIMGQRGTGKTTMVNRLLEVDWNTCSYDTGTYLPHMKFYERTSPGMEEVVLIPRIKPSRKSKASLSESSIFDFDMSLYQYIEEEIIWDVVEESLTTKTFRPGIERLRFVDLMGIGESILKENQYYEIYRAYLQKATHVLWLTSAHLNTYRADERALEVIRNDMNEIEQFTIALNKADLIAPAPNGLWTGVLTEYQQQCVEEKRETVAAYFQSFLPNQLISPSNVIPFSAISGWNFDRIIKLFFE